jgi:hypothetical protein
MSIVRKYCYICKVHFYILLINAVLLYFSFYFLYFVLHILTGNTVVELFYNSLITMVLASSGCLSK